MFRALLAFVLVGGFATGVLLLAPPLMALLTLGGVGMLVLLVAALTSAFHRPAEGHDRLLGV